MSILILINVMNYLTAAPGMQLDAKNEEAAGSIVVGALTCSVLMAVLVLIVIVDLPSIFRDVVFLKENLHCFLYGLNIAKELPKLKTQYVDDNKAMEPRGKRPGKRSKLFGSF